MCGVCTYESVNHMSNTATALSRVDYITKRQIKFETNVEPKSFAAFIAHI